VIYYVVCVIEVYVVVGYEVGGCVGSDYGLSFIFWIFVL